MGEAKRGCQKSKEKGERDPKTCSREQIRECHGDEKDHPCEAKTKR